MTTDARPTITPGMCDEDGTIAVCADGCGQVHSPYWTAEKAAAMHRRGTGHRVIVDHFSTFPAKGMICDFCSSPNVSCAFPARNVSINATPETQAETGLNLVLNSASGWAACETCRVLIVNGDRDGLHARSFATIPGGAGADRAMRRIISREIRKIHDDFWRSREGAPIPTTPDDEDPTR
jgi:hypothetical protein